MSSYTPILIADKTNSVTPKIKIISNTHRGKLTHCELCSSPASTICNLPDLNLHGTLNTGCYRCTIEHWKGSEKLN